MEKVLERQGATNAATTDSVTYLEADLWVRREVRWDMSISPTGQKRAVRWVSSCQRANEARRNDHADRRARVVSERETGAYDENSADRQAPAVSETAGRG